MRLVPSNGVVRRARLPAAGGRVLAAQVYTAATRIKGRSAIVPQGFTNKVLNGPDRQKLNPIPKWMLSMSLLLVSVPKSTTPSGLTEMLFGST